MCDPKTTADDSKHDSAAHLISKPNGLKTAADVSINVRGESETIQSTPALQAGLSKATEASMADSGKSKAAISCCE